MDLKLHTSSGFFELYPDEGIVLKRKLLGATGLNSGTVAFTKEFKIPATDHNNILLGHYENKDVVNTLNPNNAVASTITIDNSVDIVGNIELLSVSWKMNRPESYTIVFYSEESNLKVIIGDKLLENVSQFDSEFEFTWTGSSVEDSWVGDLPGQADVYIPIISWNRWYRWYSSPQGHADDINGATTGVLLSELRVGMDIQKFVSQIGREFDLTFTFDSGISDFLDSAYVIPTKVADVIFSANPSHFETDVETASFSVSTTRAKILMATETSDPSDNWNTTTSLYTAEFSGVYRLRFTLESSSNYKRELFVVKNSDNSDLGSVMVNGEDADVYINVTLAATTEYRFEIHEVLGSHPAHTCAIRFRTDLVPISILTTTFSPTAQMPEMRAIDFLSGFLKAFNLIILPGATEDAYTIYDTIALFSAGTTLDISENVDQQILTYKKTDVYEEINYRHKEGKDAPNVAFKDVSGRNYAEMIYRPDVDYGSGKADNTSIFDVFPPAYMSSYDAKDEVDGVSDLRHHFQLSNATPPKPVLAKFMLLYNNGVSEVDSAYYIQDAIDGSGNPTYQRMTTYGSYSQVQTFVSTATSNTLSYEEENVFIGAKAGNTIVNKFYLDWLSQIYSNTAYTIDVTFPAELGLYLKIVALPIIHMNGITHFISEYSYDTGKEIITLNLIRYDGV